MKQTINDQNHIQSIPVLSFYMTCIIVIYHVMLPAYTVSEFDAEFYGWIKTLNEQLATIALSYFFGITGYLLFKNMTKDTILRKLKTRFFSLFIPYVIWQALILGLHFLTGRFQSVDTLLFNLKAIFLFKSYPPDVPLWYVYTVFVWVLLSPIIYLLLKKKTLGFVALMASFIGLYLITTSDVFGSFYHYGIIPRTFKYPFAFLMGAYFGIHFPDPKDLGSLKYVAITILFGFAITSTQLVEFRNSFLIAVIPILLLRFFPDKLCKDRKIYHTSFIIFAIHYPLYQYFLDFVNKLKFIRQIPTSVTNISARILFLSAVVALSYLIYTLLSRFAPKVLKLITGNRA